MNRPLNHMEIKEINNQLIWDNFVTSLPDYTFLQSWAWGEINKAQGEKLWRFGLFEGGEILGVCQVFTVSSRRGKFIFAPHGPLIKNSSTNTLGFIINHLISLARKEKCVYLRISPWLTDEPENRKLFQTIGFRKAPTFMHAEKAWLIDIRKSETELLSEMRKTTRNLISRGLRENIEITKSNDSSDFDILYNLQIETAKRNHFVPFSKKFLHDEFATFSQTDNCLIFTGKINNTVTAAALIIFYGKIAFYHVSGSIETKEPVNYLLQWKVIEEAKQRGCEIYNMWGIAPHDQPDHPWVGLSNFKMGFGGYAKDYLPSYDFPLSKKYFFSYLIEKLPRTLRAKL